MWSRTRTQAIADAKGSRDSQNADFQIFNSSEREHRRYESYRSQLCR
jgi:hypothetical protein